MSLRSALQKQATAVRERTAMVPICVSIASSTVRGLSVAAPSMAGSRIAPFSSKGVAMSRSRACSVKVQAAGPGDGLKVDLRGAPWHN